MADIVFSTQASLDATTGMLAPQFSGLIAGAAIAHACTPCYVKASDGKAYPCDGTANDEKAVFAGICPRVANAGEPVTLLGIGSVFKLADETLTPGAKLYLSSTAGNYADAPSVGDSLGVLQAMTASVVRVVRGITDNGAVPTTIIAHAEVAQTKASAGVTDVLAAASSTRIIVGTITVTESFAAGDGAAPTFTIGEEGGSATKFTVAADLTGKAVNSKIAFGGTLTAGKKLQVTAVAGTGTTETGAIQIDVIAAG